MTRWRLGDHEGAVSQAREAWRLCEASRWVERGSLLLALQSGLQAEAVELMGACGQEAEARRWIDEAIFTDLDERHPLENLQRSAVAIDELHTKVARLHDERGREALLEGSRVEGGEGAVDGHRDERRHRGCAL